MEKLKLRQGFTLAEVLITLGVIGIVAALTIPTLIANYQKAQYIAGLKRAYSEFNQALLQMSADKGCPNDLKCSGIFSSSLSPEEAGKEIAKQFKVVKDCGMQADQGCFSNNISEYYNGSGSRSSMDLDSYYKFITADNMSFLIYDDQGDCSHSENFGINTHTKQVCGYIYVDVNGPNKGPNNKGRDIFSFYITNGKGALLYPFGGKELSFMWAYWKSSSKCMGLIPGFTDDGNYCAARIMEEGWQMNY